MTESLAVPLRTIAREWTRLGCIGFGGPPTHIALLRRLCVADRGWIDGREFEDAIAAVNLLPGPASTQLTIFAARRLRGPLGGLVGGACFIAPGLLMIVALSAVFLARHPPAGIVGAAAGAGAVVPAVAVRAAGDLFPSSWERIGGRSSERARWLFYAAAGAVAAATIGPYLVLILLACGLAEIGMRRAGAGTPAVVGLAGHAVAAGAGALVWTAFKVGALSYGGGFVIIPLMQHDAVSSYHWMTGTQFLGAVALGQVTPGPVVLTVAVVGYAAGGVPDALLATLVAFTPSFLFVIGGAPYFDRLRANPTVQDFLTGAGPAVIGAIAGAAISLGLAFQHLWQIPVLAGGLVWLLVLRRGVVSGLLLGAAVGALVAAAGVPA